MTETITKQNKNNECKKTAKAYCMIVGSDAPSSKPSPLLHFTLDPLRHKLDARTRANKSRALMNARVSAYDFSHFAAMLVEMCFKISISVAHPIALRDRSRSCNANSQLRDDGIQPCQVCIDKLDPSPH